MKVIQQLVLPTLDGPPLSPNSDFKRFVEGIQSSRVTSGMSNLTANARQRTDGAGMLSFPGFDIAPTSPS